MLSSKDYQARKEINNSAELLNSGLIKLITGPRRAGKSVFALQMLQGKNYAYLNFDDNSLLSNFEEKAVMKALSEVYPDYEYLILDEIQNLKAWNLWVAALYRRGINLLITGSNANLLSGEMASALTGRYIETLIMPFSMNETLQYKQVNMRPEMPEDEAALSNAIEDYLKNGGYPEIVKTREIEKAYLGYLFDSIILKDVARRHKVRKTAELYDLADYLISNYSNPLSFNRIAEDMRLASVTTVKKFCKYLEESYLFFFLPRLGRKQKEMMKADRKVYVVDTGFVQARSLELSPNYGRQLENMVFVELLRRGFDIKKNELFYYHTANGKEIDFVTRKGSSIDSLIQVSYEISKEKTFKRELDAIVEASEELNCKKLILVTRDADDRVSYKGKDIQIISAGSWFLK